PAPNISKLAPLPLLSPPSVTVVAALRVLSLALHDALPILARVPPIVRLPPPVPPIISRSSAPLLVKAPVTVSIVVPSSLTVPLLVKALLRVSGAVSDSWKKPALLVNPLPPALNAKVAGWVDEPNTSKLAPLALVSPPRVRVVAALRVLLLGPTCTDPVLARVPPIVRLPPPVPPIISRSSAPLLVKAPVTVSIVVPSSLTVPLL